MQLNRSFSYNQQVSVQIAFGNAIFGFAAFSAVLNFKLVCDERQLSE